MYQAENETYPWRRRPYAFADAKPACKPLSAEAAEFVPRWARQEEPAAAADGNCYLISLEGYSDDEEPMPHKVASVKAAVATTESSSAAVPSAATAPPATTSTTVPGRAPVTRSTDEPSRPWRVAASSSASKAGVRKEVETADSKTRPAGKLPPWRRAAAKAATRDIDEKEEAPCQPHAPPPLKQATVSQSLSSLGTTDSTASMTTTLDSDIATSEDSAEEEVANEITASLGEQKIIEEKAAECLSSGESSCATEAEPEAEEDASPQVAVFEVSALLRWRCAVDADERSVHEVPGRLTAWSESTGQFESGTSPKASSVSKAKRSSLTASTASSPSASGSWRREAKEVASRREPDERQESHIEAPVPSGKQLQISQNSWAAQMRARRGQQTDDPNVRSDEEVVRAMKSILNKLTIEKFPQLYQQMVSCGIRTASHLEQLIQEVFEKATTQHHFIDMYADLCAQLHAHFAKNPITNDPNMSFKKILLNACQASFEKNLTPPANLASMDLEERTTAEFQYKMRMLGNIRFIGALLVRKMLASKVMLAIMEELLTEPTPEALETLAALLTVVGGDFDTETFTHRVALNAIFKQVQSIVKKSTTAARVRCLLKDVLDLRASGWQDRKPKKMEKPSTLEEVHQKAAEEDGTFVGPAGKASPGQWTTASHKPAGVRPASGAGSLCNSSAMRKEKRREEEIFDREACHTEVVRTLSELFVSHDVEEAVTCIADVRIPASHQASELADVLAFLVEEGSAQKRKVGFACVVKLFLTRHWKRSALADGLHLFVEDVCPELKFDVPALSQIIREELRPSLTPAVEAGILQASRLEVLANLSD